MRVHILLAWGDHGGNSIDGYPKIVAVFDSEEKALAERNRLTEKVQIYGGNADRECDGWCGHYGPYEGEEEIARIMAERGYTAVRRVPSRELSGFMNAELYVESHDVR